MRRLITGVATGALALGLIAGPALAGQCPALIKQIRDAAGSRFDAGAASAKVLAAQAEELHKAGKHPESIAKSDEAAKAMGLKIMKK
jgi:hypothetical protein